MTHAAVRNLMLDMRAYAAEAIELVGERSAEQVAAERMREHSVLRTVTIVGEAAAQTLKLQPQGFERLELRQAASFRNMIVHGYGKVRLEKVIDVVRGDLPRLIEALDRILGEQDT